MPLNDGIEQNKGNILTGNISASYDLKTFGKIKNSGPYLNVPSRLGKYRSSRLGNYRLGLNGQV
jgi:hypothetical protein